MHGSALPSGYFFSFDVPAPTQIYTLSLHDALPISVFPRQRDVVVLQQAVVRQALDRREVAVRDVAGPRLHRSEEHTSELQSHSDLVCRLLLEKKKTDHVTREHTEIYIIQPSTYTLN